MTTATATPSCRVTRSRVDTRPAGGWAGTGGGGRSGWASGRRTPPLVGPRSRRSAFTAGLWLLVRPVGGVGVGAARRGAGPEAAAGGGAAVAAVSVHGRPLAAGGPGRRRWVRPARPSGGHSPADAAAPGGPHGPGAAAPPAPGRTAWPGRRLGRGRRRSRPSRGPARGPRPSLPSALRF